MKKFLVLLFLIFFTTPALSATWVEIFEKKYIDIESISYDPTFKRIKFWTKNLRKDPKEKYPNYSGQLVPYWYSLDLFVLDCKNQKSRMESFTVYDLKQNIIYSDDKATEWHHIIPDTYMDGYYRLFCLVPFEENPLLNEQLTRH